MSVKDFHNYQFNAEHGFSGNLAADPTFAKTKAGQEYALMTVYCNRQLTADEQNNKNNHRKEADTAKRLALKAHVRVYAEDLLDLIEKDVKKGCLVNFWFDYVTFSSVIDEENDELYVKAFVTANRLEVRYSPEAKTQQPKRNRQISHEQSANQNKRIREKK